MPKDSAIARLARFAGNAVRNSPWLVISIAAHVVGIAVLSIVYVQHQAHADEGIACGFEITKTIHEPPPEPIPLPEPTLVRTPVDKGEVELVPDDALLSALLSDPSLDSSRYDEPIGNPAVDSSTWSGGSDASTTIGPGKKAGHVGPGPSPLGYRPGSGNKGGRSPVAPPAMTERAVFLGLQWLVRHQSPDGSWSAASLRKCCLPDHPCVSEGEALSDEADVGLTGLALLAFLGAGHSNQSEAILIDDVRAKRYRLSDVVRNGLQWLVKRQQPDGSFSGDRVFLYNEALAALALSEAYGLTLQRYWKEPAQKAVDFLVAAQKPSPIGDGLWGWRYSPRGFFEAQKDRYTDPQSYQRDLCEADTSVTGWVVMALKSAELSGLDVPGSSLQGALDFATWATQGSSGLVGYLGPDGAGLPISGPGDNYAYHVATMSALGICIRAFIEHDLNDPFFDQGAKKIIEDLPQVSKDKLSVDYYYWYYATLALNQLDGPDSPRRTGRYWDPWNKAMTEAVLGLQDKTDKACSKGGWIVGDRWTIGGGVGPVYSTAINVLTLEVYYRYSNAFGGKPK
jgi:hypothetical protein